MTTFIERSLLRPALQPVVAGQSTHGPYKQRGWYSQVGQDKCVASLFQNTRNAYYIDLAANDARYISNTYFLDRNLSWAGVCIEANTKYLAGLLTERSCTVMQAVVADRSGKARFRFAGASGGVMRGADESAIRDLIAERFNRTKNRGVYHGAMRAFRDVDVVGIVDVLRAARVPREIAYLSLDVEGSELPILRAFPWEAHVIDVISIERPPAELHRLVLTRGYCVRAVLGNDIGDVLYVRRAARNGTLQARRFDELGLRRFDAEAPCYSHTPIARDLAAFMRRGEWCAGAELPTRGPRVRDFAV